ncbi:MAG: hypothetical protein J3R72DRAFT_442108 [Linnemannia gamsii]|nr:MAG: hypothetical protein J3R72DRAFT_442108 [Linnemannia gamsii]
MMSLFQKVQSQAIAYHNHPEDHISSTHGPPTVNAAEVALPPSPKLNSPSGVFIDTSSEQTQQQAALLEERHERKQLIRAKAQEVRLELLALEQLEKEMDSGMDDNESTYNDLAQLFSPIGSPMGLLSSSPASVYSGSCVHLEPTSGLVRHSPQSPYPDLAFAESQQFQDYQRRMPSTSRSIPSRGSSLCGTIHGVSPISNLAVGTGIRRRSGTVASAPSPTSPHSSPSPPISPLSESYTVEGVIAARDRNTSMQALAHAKKVVGWRPNIDVQDAWDNHNHNHHSQAVEDEEDGLQEYLHGSEEDLRDVTLSDMMARNLNLLSDNYDSDIGNNSLEQEQELDSDQGSDHDYDEANMTMVDRTCIFMSNLEHDFDQQEAAGQGIPSLLSETLPVNDYDMSFMSDSELPDRNSPMTPGSSLLPPQRNRTSQWLQTRQLPPVFPAYGTGTTGKDFELLKSRPPLPLSPESRRSFQAPSLTPTKEMMVEEFLRSLPPLPQSPESKRPLQLPSLKTSPARESVFIDSFPPLPQSPATLKSFPRDNMLGAMNSPSQAVQIGSGRTHPILAPIVTSKEHCQQILQRRIKNSDHRRHTTPPSATHSQSPLSSASPVTISHYSEFSTPIPCDDLLSELSTPTSAYHSAREEFSQSSTHSQQESPDMTGMKMSPGYGGSSMNISSELIQPPPAPAQETRRARIEATEAILTGSPHARYQPLDMIIIRPAKANTCPLPKDSPLRPGSGGSSPWSPLSPTQSIDSRHSEGTGGLSSWSWSYPSSLQSTAGSLGSTSVDGLPVYTGVEGRDAILRRRPNPSTSTAGIKIKSRSMSSLTKQQHGWLSFQALDVRMVASGQCHIVVVTRTNQVYSCWEPNNNENADSKSTLMQETSGRDLEVTLGRSVNADNGAGYVQDTALHPVLVEIGGLDALESPVVKVVCSDNATFLLTKTGDLWGWGYFEDMNGAKIGLIHHDSAARPIQISSHSQRVKDVVCGKNHVLILNAAGDVISWGSNEYGQLARQRTPSHSPLLSSNAAFDLSPHFIENLPTNILGIGANKTGSFAWDENQLYAWGDNTFGQLGYESNTSSASRWKQSIGNTSSHDSVDIVVVPRKVALHWKGRSIKQVLGGLRHTVILSTSGLIITLGDDEFGQLGAISQSTQVSSALVSRSAPPFNSSHNRVGQSPFSSPSSSSLVNFDSQLSSSSISSDVSGEGMSSSASPRLRSRRLNPTLVRVGPRVKEISCGDFHTTICCENGQMYAWGQGFDGILAIHNAYIGTQPSPKTGYTDSSSSSSLRDKARKVVAVSTMQHGVSVALVSSA